MDQARTSRIGTKTLLVLGLSLSLGTPLRAGAFGRMGSALGRALGRGSNAQALRRASNPLLPAEIGGRKVSRSFVKASDGTSWSGTAQTGVWSQKVDSALAHRLQARDLPTGRTVREGGEAWRRTSGGALLHRGADGVTTRFAQVPGRGLVATRSTPSLIRSQPGGMTVRHHGEISNAGSMSETLIGRQMRTDLVPFAQQRVAPLGAPEVNPAAVARFRSALENGPRSHLRVVD